MPPLQTAAGPVMLGVGALLIVTVMEQVEGQLLVPRLVTLTVYVPEGPAVTVTELPVVPLVIIPLPLIPQLYEVMGKPLLLTE